MGDFYKPRFDLPPTQANGNQYETKIRPLSELEEFFNKYIQPNIEKNKIDEGDFTDVYSEEDIAIDHAKVKERQAIFEKALLGSNHSAEQLDVYRQLDILAKEFEAICSDHTILSRGLGMKRGEVKAQSASDFDDIVHQTDLILEFPREKSNSSEAKSFSFGVDVTVSKKSFEKKFAEMYRRLDRGTSMAPIKYFRESADGIEDARLPKMGQVEIPRYIVNAKIGELQELIDGWKLWRDEFQPASDTKQKTELLDKTKLAQSHLWYRILYQIQRQSGEFMKYLEKSDPKTASVYRNQYILTSKIIYNLVLKYIQDNEEWSERYSDIQRERDDLTRQVRMDHLRRTVHEEFRGEDMNYLMKIITNKNQNPHQ